jgi:hypothetical protein
MELVRLLFADFDESVWPGDEDLRAVGELGLR